MSQNDWQAMNRQIMSHNICLVNSPLRTSQCWAASLDYQLQTLKLQSLKSANLVQTDRLPFWKKKKENLLFILCRVLFYPNLQWRGRTVCWLQALANLYNQLYEQPVQVSSQTFLSFWDCLRYVCPSTLKKRKIFGFYLVFWVLWSFLSFSFCRYNPSSHTLKSFWSPNFKKLEMANITEVQLPVQKNTKKLNNFFVQVNKAKASHRKMVWIHFSRLKNGKRKS